MSSLTLNICKEAQLFYQNEQKIRENHQDGIHPSSTIHMKSYFPVQSIDYSRSINDLYHRVEGRNREHYHRKTNELIANKKRRVMDNYGKKSNEIINSKKNGERESRIERKNER